MPRRHFLLTEVHFSSGGITYDDICGRLKLDDSLLAFYPQH